MCIELVSFILICRMSGNVSCVHVWERLFHSDNHSTLRGSSQDSLSRHSSWRKVLNDMRIREIHLNGSNKLITTDRMVLFVVAFGNSFSSRIIWSVLVFHDIPNNFTVVVGTRFSLGSELLKSSLLI